MRKDKPILIIVDQDELHHIDNITRYSSLAWDRKFTDVGTFEFWCELDKKNVELIKKERIVWFKGEKEAGIILSFQEETQEDGSKKLDVKGKMISQYLTRRIVWGTYTCSSKKNISQIMKELVSENMIETMQERKIEKFVIQTDTEEFGEKIQYQQTGKEVLSALQELSDACNNSIGFRISLDLENEQMIFNVIQGKDRSLGNADGNEPVVLSTNMSDILESKYSTSCADEKTTALVAGAGEDVDRIKVISGDSKISGIYRKEMYVDARDLQKKNADNTEIDAETYNSMLDMRGMSKLGEHVVEESFDVTVRTVGNVNYEFEKDYFIGDIITVEDSILGIRANVRILNVNESWDNSGYVLKMTYGYTQLSIMNKIKRVIS